MPAPAAADGGNDFVLKGERAFYAGIDPVLDDRLHAYSDDDPQLFQLMVG